MNINSSRYWNDRFASGAWESVGGFSQTTHFARAQVRRMQVSPAFGGTIIDFGCGAGDAVAVFHEHWKSAGIVGIDFSEAAITLARQRHGQCGRFVCGTAETCPTADVIVASNVLEHIEDDLGVARILQAKCHNLFIFVPFEEQFLIEEHVHRYGWTSFAELGVLRVQPFPCRGWSHFGLRNRWWNIHAKNVLRPWFGRQRLNRRLQVMYQVKGTLGG